jgi:hypothetical protein
MATNESRDGAMRITALLREIERRLTYVVTG